MCDQSYVTSYITGCDCMFLGDLSHLASSRCPHKMSTGFYPVLFFYSLWMNSQADVSRLLSLSCFCLRERDKPWSPPRLRGSSRPKSANTKSIWRDVYHLLCLQTSTGKARDSELQRPGWNVNNTDPKVFTLQSKQYGAVKWKYW